LRGTNLYYVSPPKVRIYLDNVELIMNVRHLALTASAALFFAACRPATRSLSSADMTAIQQGTDDFLRHLRAGNADSMSLLYAEDAVMMPANASELHGRAAIRTLLASYPAVADVALLNDTVVGFGDLAYVKGRYRVRLAVEGAPADSGKFIEIRRRSPDGSWHVVVEISNSNVPLPPR
jgi:ketosteroid isomerase-like protein